MLRMLSHCIRAILRFCLPLALLLAAVLVIGGSLPVMQPVLAQDTGRDQGLYRLPESRTPFFVSGSLASNSNNVYLVTANMLNNTISRIDRARGDTVIETTVGRDPRTVAITPDDTRIVVVNRGDGTLSVVDLLTMTVTATYPVGLLPYGVVTSSNSSAWVTLEGTDEVIRIALATGEIEARISVPDAPAGLALWGDFLYVTHLWSGNFSLLYIPQNRTVETISSAVNASLTQAVAIDPQRGIAYLPQSRLNSDNPALTVDSTVLPNVAVLNLASFSIDPTLQIRMSTADQPVNMPFAAVVDISRRWLYVANAGSNNISVIDLVTGLSVTTFTVKSNPRGMILSNNAGQVYVHNMIDGTVTVFDTAELTVVDEIPVSRLSIPTDIYIGAQLFHSAADPRMTTDQWVSCASCHFDGQSDGRVWQLPPGIISEASGPRNTPTLYDLEGHTRYTWDGSWDELADVELKIRRLQAGTGLITEAEPGVNRVNPPLDSPHSGISPELDTLTAYLLSLDGPTVSPPQDLEMIERGREVFESMDCTSCHRIENQDQLYDVGTGGEFRVPVLRWLWQSAPYFHDGRAETLFDVFVLPGEHQLTSTIPYEDVEALTVYLLSLPQPETAASEGDSEAAEPTDP